MNLLLREKLLIPMAYIAGAFFAARCVIFGEFCPTGCAYLALALSQNRLFPAVFVAVLGVLSRYTTVNVWGYVTAYLLICIINGTIGYLRLVPSDKGRTVIVAFCTLIGGIVAFVFGTAEAWRLITVLPEAVLSGLLTQLFTEGIRAVKYGGGKELCGVALLLGCIYAGMNDISIFGLPFVIPIMSVTLPFFMGKRVLAGADGKYIRQSTAARLNGFAGSLDRLSEAMSVICKRVDDRGDEIQLKRALAKCRAVLCDELSCLSTQLRRIEKELMTELVPDSETGKRVSERLKSCGIRFVGVLVYKHNKRYEVRVIRRFGSNCVQCKSRIASEISKVLGVKMTLGNNICSKDNNNCIIKLYEEHPYHISVYAAAKKRDGSDVSGDSHTFMELKYGTYMLALSDGMGSGGRAREESAASVELFEDFMEAGFERNAALEQINSLLLIRAGNEDIFATMDICNVDLYTAKAEFVKIGGMPGFIARKNNVDIIGSGGLPVGIVDKPEVESVETQLSSGDTIVMVTDGVLDAAPCAVGKEKWLADVIRKHSNLPPEVLCKNILAEAKETNMGRIADDMTVIAAKVWKAKL